MRISLLLVFGTSIGPDRRPVASVRGTFVVPVASYGRALSTPG